MNIMPLCTGLYMGDINSEDFDDICKTLKGQFTDAEGKPENWEEWINDAVYDSANREIRVVSDTPADPSEYAPFLKNCVSTIAAQHPNAKLRGFYDLYNGNYGSNCCFFTVENQLIDWADENDVDMEYMASSLIEIAAESGYEFEGNPSLVRMISFVRALADSADEYAVEALDNFKYFLG